MIGNINYINQLNFALEKMQADPEITPHHISLYMAIFSMWNSSGWRQTLTPSREELCYRAKIGSNNTYHKCLKDLDRLGYIVYSPSNSPIVASKITCIRFDITADTTGGIGADIAADSTDATIYKLVNYKTSKQVNGATPDFFSNVSSTQTRNNTRLKFTPPTLDEVKMFFQENRQSIAKAEKAYQYYLEGKWRDVKGKPIVNWKQKMISVWFEELPKEKPIVGYMPVYDQNEAMEFGRDVIIGKVPIYEPKPGMMQSTDPRLATVPVKSIKPINA
jgi:hypothetical protein